MMFLSATHCNGTQSLYVKHIADDIPFYYPLQRLYLGTMAPGTCGRLCQFGGVLLLVCLYWELYGNSVVFVTVAKYLWFVIKHLVQYERLFVYPSKEIAPPPPPQIELECSGFMSFLICTNMSKS